MNEIVVRGARVHNLKNITVRIPKNKLVVITGLSGSGKSSLAMDTIYAEGQRRYLESLSTYARQFLGELKRPDVDEIEGLSPAIAIDQKTVSHNPRSTVGTVTEIYDYLRVLYARIGKAHCPECGRPLEKKSVDEILQDLFNSFREGSRIYILAPIATEKKGTFKKEIEEFASKGFTRVEIDGEMYRLEEVPELDKNRRHTVKLVVDRLTLESKNEHRILDSLELAMREGKGFVEVRNVDSGESRTFSENLMCPVCGIGFPEITPKLFSFNSPYGACPNCHGLGFTFEVDPSLVVDEERSVLDGAIIPYRWDRRLSRWVARELERRGFSAEVPFKNLPEEAKKFVLYGDDHFEGVVPKVERWHRETESSEMKEWLEKNFVVQRTCSLCGGKRLNREALSVRINGLNIHEFTELSIEEELAFLKNLKLTEREQKIAGELLNEIEKRLEFLMDVGLGYLNLSRSATTLSGGESQRIRLATQIGSGLTGVIYLSLIHI